MGAVSVSLAAVSPARSNGRLAGWLTFVGLFTTLSYAGRFLADAEPERDFVYRWSSAVASLVQYGFILGIIMLIAARGPARELFALRRPRDWRRALGLMALILVGILVVGGILDPFLEAGEEQGLTPEGWDGDRALPFAVNFALIAGLVPVVEELTFRGLGYSLLQRFGPIVAILAVGILFGLAHGLVRALPILAAFGIALAWLRSRTDSVLPCILLHAAFNAFALVASVTLAAD